MDEDSLKSYLGRSLSDSENCNFNLYLKIAKLRLSDLLCREVDEFDPLPADLGLVLARFFGVIDEENFQKHGVANKRVEDFSITYDNAKSLFGEVVRANSATIGKYSKCGAIRHGKVEHDGFRCV
jgi:hypothetical protein